MLGIDEMITLEDVLRVEFEDHMTEILIRLNRNGDLDAFLDMIGMKHLIAEEPKYVVFKNAKIVVIGQSSVEADKLLLTAKKLGISPNRLEMHLDYEDGKTINLEKYRYNVNYSAIIFGPVPHSGISKGDYGSVISAAEHEPGYPPVIRLGDDNLRITKSVFKDVIRDMLAREIIIPDLIA